MQQNFEYSLSHVLMHEGGWSDHPRDPGGATMKGITLATFRRYFGENQSKDDLRAISDTQLRQIYASGYWDKCHCNELPAGIDYAVFDGAVNSGPGRSIRWLQLAVNASSDGIIGPITLAKVTLDDADNVTNKICDERLSFLRRLSTWSVFGRGWERRVENVRTTASTMARGEIPLALPVEEYDIIRKGSTGNWVRKLQTALEIQVDGIFGEMTEEALKAWQQANGLQVDGIAGRNTYRSLGLLS